MAKTAKQTAPKIKRSRTKETFSELKKVNWPSFGKTMKQTGMVLSVVVLFTLVVLAIDVGVSELIKVLSNI